MVTEISPQALHQSDRRRCIARIGRHAWAREPVLEILWKACEKTCLVRRIHDCSAIHRANTHRDANPDLVIGAKLRPNLAFVVPGSIAVVRVNCGGDALRNHAGSRQFRDRIRIEDSTASAVTDPRLEKVVVVAQLDLAQATSMLMGIDESRHHQAAR